MNAGCARRLPVVHEINDTLCAIEADQWRRRLNQLRLEVERRLTDIQTLWVSETYQTLAANADWNAWLADARKLEEDDHR